MIVMPHYIWNHNDDDDIKVLSANNIWFPFLIWMQSLQIKEKTLRRLMSDKTLAKYNLIWIVNPCTNLYSISREGLHKGPSPA